MTVGVLDNRPPMGRAPYASRAPARRFRHRSPDFRQVIAEGFDQIAVHTNRIARLVTISRSQLDIRIWQQPDCFAEQEHWRRHMLFAQPWRVGIAVSLTFLPPDVAGLYASC
jgi:hypothetical protein